MEAAPQHTQPVSIKPLVFSATQEALTNARSVAGTQWWLQSVVQNSRRSEMHSTFENLGMQFIKPGDTVYQKKAADHELLIKYLPVESPLKPYRWGAL